MPHQRVYTATVLVCVCMGMYGYWLLATAAVSCSTHQQPTINPERQQPVGEWFASLVNPPLASQPLILLAIGRYLLRILIGYACPHSLHIIRTNRNRVHLYPLRTHFVPTSCPLNAALATLGLEYPCDAVRWMCDGARSLVGYSMLTAAENALCKCQLPVVHHHSIATKRLADPAWRPPPPTSPILNSQIQLPVLQGPSREAHTHQRHQQ